MSTRILYGDALASLQTLDAGSIQCCVTSPPYWGLRSYLPADHPLKHLEIGAEKTPAEYIEKLVAVFREARRVLRDDGVLWLNLGDSYANTKIGNTNGGTSSGLKRNRPNSREACNARLREDMASAGPPSKEIPDGAKPKDLLLIPYRVALALQADGWYLRASIPWVKANVMPASVTDRPTVAHESIFLLTKSARYFYDADAVRVPSAFAERSLDTPGTRATQAHAAVNGHRDSSGGVGYNPAGRNRRTSDWWRESLEIARAEIDKALASGGMLSDGEGEPLGLMVNTKPYAEAHFAVFPPKLIEPCIKAGSRAGDTVLDPFGGSGTVAQVCSDLGRHAVLCELNEANAPLAGKRTAQMGLACLFAEIAAKDAAA